MIGKTRNTQTPPPQISEAEAKIMEAFWRNGAMSSGELVVQVAEVSDWSPKTVRTLLGRLEHKGAVRRSGDRPHRFTPAFSRDQWLAGHAGSLIRSHCGGRVAPLLAAFSRQERISARDREEILSLLEALK